MGRSAAAKERQRKHNSLRYYSTLVGLNESRSLVAQLSLQHRAAIARYEQQLQLKDTDQSYCRALGQYVAASSLVEELNEEKKSLMTLLDERQLLQHQITLSVDHLMTNSTAARMHMEAHLATAVAPSVSFRPMSKDDCAALVDAYYANVRRFLQTRLTTSPQSSATDWSRVDGVMQKTMLGYTPLELSSRSWDVQVSSAESTSIYPPTLNSTMQCLQQVDANNAILFERFRPTGDSVSFYSLMLASRFETEDGYVEVLLPLDRSRISCSREDLDDSERWLEMTTWILYQRCEDQEKQCRIILGGSIACETKEDTQRMTMEMRSVTMRWESKLTGQPKFRLPSG